LHLYKHHDLKWEQIQFKIIPDGIFEGRLSLEIQGLVDKSNKITVSNTEKRQDSIARGCVCMCLGKKLCVPCLVKEYKALCRPLHEMVYCHQKGFSVLTESWLLFFLYTNYKTTFLYLLTPSFIIYYIAFLN